MGDVAGGSVPATSTAAGDWYVINAAGTSQSITWAIGDIAIYEGTSGNWSQIVGAGWGVAAATEADALAGVEPLKYLSPLTGNARVLHGTRSRRLTDVLYFDGVTTGVRAYAALGSPGGIGTGDFSLDFPELRIPSTAPAATQGLFVFSNSPAAVDTNVCLAGYLISTGTVGALRLNIGNSAGTDRRYRDSTVSLTTLYPGKTIHLTVRRTAGVMSVLVNGVALAFGADSTAGTAPSFADSFASGYLVLGCYGTTDLWKGGLMRHPVLILGTMTDAEVLDRVQTGRLPSWCDVGAGNAAGLYISDFSSGVNGFLANGAGFSLAAVGGRLQITTSAGANAGGAYRTSPTTYKAGAYYRVRFTHKLVSGTTTAWNFTDASGSNRFSSVSGSTLFTPVGTDTVHEVIVRANANNPQMFFFGATVPYPNAVVEITGITIHELGPIAKWSIRSGRILPDTSGNKINLVLAAGVAPVTEDFHGSVIQTALTANGELIDTAGVIPTDAVIEDVVVRNTTGNAVTGFALGMTSGADELTYRVDIPANSTVICSIKRADCAGLTAGTYTMQAATFGRVYYSATSWNSGSLNISVRYRRERGI